MNWFARKLLDWYDAHGRHQLPWQQNRTPYRVWVSEIMLQQTQVATVIPYYERFMAHFPTVTELATADIDEVLKFWTGLGYYARGRNLHKAAQQIVREHSGAFPEGVDALVTLPGIGRSTAGAIAALAQGLRAPILDGNVKRVLGRFHAIDGYPGQSLVGRRHWHFAEYHTPSERVADYTQAIMDLGATLCVARRPTCEQCPLGQRCEARALDAVDQFPGRKKPVAKPTRRAYVWLLVSDDQRCLLERRPVPGLWGGLWTPPQTSLEADTAPTPEPLLDELLETVGENDSKQPAIAALAPFRHSFTHFHLELLPLKVQLGDVEGSTVASDDRWHWLPIDAEPDRGLSRPALRLLELLRNQS